MKKIQFNKRFFVRRMIVLIPVFIIILVAHVSFVLKRTWHFLLYGGELVNFEKPERETIAGIYEMLKEIKQLKEVQNELKNSID